MIEGPARYVFDLSSETESAELVFALTLTMRALPPPAGFGRLTSILLAEASARVFAPWTCWTRVGVAGGWLWVAAMNT
ncbi:MAG: hypothetical protein DMD87_05300 [Candidatus Rokuibacteriota bacterium]|nr:MAG: hypothetical protein DMD87_05300 [Candidatus Rokubacteria bacterium]